MIEISKKKIVCALLSVCQSLHINSFVQVSSQLKVKFDAIFESARYTKVFNLTCTRLTVVFTVTPAN